MSLDLGIKALAEAIGADIKEIAEAVAELQSAPGGGGGSSSAISFPALADFSDNYGISGVMMSTAALSTLDFSNRQLQPEVCCLVPIRLEAGFPITKLGVQVLTAKAAATINVAIATIDPLKGWPGTVLACANNLPCNTTGLKLGTIPATLIPPGWYWSILHTSATVGLSSTEQFVSGPLGAMAGYGTRIHRGVFRNRTFGNFTVGASAMAGSTGSISGPDNEPYPTIIMK